MAHIILSICQVWFRFEFLKSYGQKPNLFLSYSFMESPLYTKRHCAPRLHVPFNQSRHVSGICRGGGLEKLGDFVFACGVAWSLTTNLSFVVLGGNMSSSLIGMLPWNPYWNKTQTLTFEMKVCSGARVVLWWSRRQWNPRPWDGNHCDGGCQQKDNGTCTRSFWCFPSRENELILTLFMRNLVVFVTKGKCAKMGNFIGFPPIKREG